jgi:hypothetical protein
MAYDEELADRIRGALEGAGPVGEVKMFGGLCFMPNGNMVAGTSRRGLLVRVGRDQHPQALTRPGARPMEIMGRSMEGCVFVDPPPRDERTMRDWLALGVAFVRTLPPKSPKLKRPRTTTA